MNSPNSPASQLLHKLLGADYIADCNTQQLDTITRAISENADGVQHLVAIARTSKSISRPIPWILSRIDKDAHLNDDQQLHVARSKISIAEGRYRAFHATYPAEGEAAALNYALEIDTSRGFEELLRRRLNLPPLPPAATPTERQRWESIHLQMSTLHHDHPLRVAVRETCTQDAERTHDEALDVLGYLEAVAAEPHAAASLVPLDDDDIPGYGDHT